MTGPRVLPDYYGPSGDDIAGAFAERERQRRLKQYDTRAWAESDERLDEEKYRFQHEKDTNPLDDAIRRAAAREHGIIGPDEQGSTDMQPGGQSGLPPASVPQGGIDPGFTRPGPSRDPDPGFSRPGPSRDIDPGFSRPAGKVMNPLYDMSPVEGTAHALPGAFNPVTGTHNPADIDLGGGYRLQSSMTPEGRRARDAQELSAANVPGVTPELALYLADHPEHMAPFFDRAYRHDAYGGRSREQWMEDERFLHSFPSRENEKPEITLAGALEQVDQMYGKRDPVSGEVHSRLNPQARLRLAREMTRGEYSHLGPSSSFGSGPSGAPSYEDAMGRRGIKVAPRTEDEQQLDASGQRATQIKQVRSMIPKGASPGRVRAILKKHGLTPQEIDQVVGQ